MTRQDEKQPVKLGQRQDYVAHYDASLLQPIPRQISRSKLDMRTFSGEDVWTAYELSWLDRSGKPEVAVAEFVIPADSPNIIESKSLKYYLNSLNQTAFSDPGEVRDLLLKDLGAVAGAPVAVDTYSLDAFVRRRAESVILGQSLDQLPITSLDCAPDRSLLCRTDDIDECVWYSDLLKSNCPVTGQPDWASVWVGYRGPRILPESLLTYIVSFRQHQDFHENCVERIYSDIQSACLPDYLWVYARYTRRGGLDINPFRSSHQRTTPRLFAIRQ